MLPDGSISEEALLGGRLRIGFRFLASHCRGCHAEHGDEDRRGQVGCNEFTSFHRGSLHRGACRSYKVGSTRWGILTPVKSAAETW